MNLQKLIAALLLIMPGLSWGGIRVTAPEPGILALLGVGGLVVGAIAFIRRKK